MAIISGMSYFMERDENLDSSWSFYCRKCGWGFKGFIIKQLDDPYDEPQLLSEDDIELIDLDDLYHNGQIVHCPLCGYKHNLIDTTDDIISSKYWNRVREWINSMPDGKTFTTRSIFSKFTTERNRNCVSSSIWYLYYAGYLDMDSHGVYTKVSSIPLEIPQSDFRKNREGKMLWIEHSVKFPGASRQKKR